MITEIILAITLIAYSATVSQSYMYIIALKNVQNAMKAPAYIELRKLLDINFRANYKYVVYSALISNLCLVVENIQSANNLFFILSAISFLALVADVVLTLKGNVPINKTINTWSPGNYPDNWESYRERWLRIFYYREIATIAGFICLVAGAVFGIN